MSKIDFEAVPLEAPWEIEQIIYQGELIRAAHIEEEMAGEPDDEAE